MRHRGPIKPQMTVHPRTGEPIVPVGFVNGLPVWPIMGGAPDDGDDDKDDDDSDSGADDDGDDADDDGPTGGADDDKVSKEEYNKLLKRLKASDRRASALEKEKQKQDDAKKDDLTKAQERVAELEAELEETRKATMSLRMNNAFLAANKHKWHDAETALDIAERHGYLEDVVDDDGNVDKKALGDALDRLAKEKSFLVQTDKKADDEPDSPSGEPAGGRSNNGKDKKADKEALQRRFPILNR